MRDDEIALAVVYVGSKGKLPPWASSDEEFVARISDVRPDAAATSLKTVRAIRQLAERGRKLSLNWTRVVATVTGWTDERSLLALKVCVNAGWLKGVEVPKA